MEKVNHMFNTQPEYEQNLANKQKVDIDASFKEA